MGRQIEARHVPALSAQLSQPLDQLEKAGLFPVQRDALDPIFEAGHLSPPFPL
jgi:hypothetical protein